MTDRQIADEVLHGWEGVLKLATRVKLHVGHLRRTHQSCYNRHGEHINPGCHGEHINPGLTGELIILLHKRVNHPVPQESESSCPTRERIILSHKRANHLVPVCTIGGGWVTLWSYVAPVGTASPQSSHSIMYATCRTLVQGFLANSKSFRKIID